MTSPNQSNTSRGREVGWMPIETAPKDSEILLAWRAVDKPGGEPQWFQTIGQWEDQFESLWDDDKSESFYRGAWTDYTVASWNYEEYAELNPTHWQPLPEPPTDAGRAALQEQKK